MYQRVAYGNKKRNSQVCLVNLIQIVFIFNKWTGFALCLDGLYIGPVILSLEKPSFSD